MAEAGIGTLVGDETFEREVLERSRETPVVVDFWAEWCGPCRALAPILERACAERAGRVVLAKVNVDEAPAVAQRYGVRSIPLVLGFRDGAPVAEFVGAQPEPVVRRFLDALLPSPAEELAAEADALRAGGHARAAEERYRSALDLEPRCGPALLGMARLRADEGELDEALDLLGRLIPTGELGHEAERLAAELRMRRGGSGDLDEARARVAAAPDDLAARTDLGRQLAAAGRHEEALEALLEVVRRDPGFADGEARRAMLDLFEVLGAEHPLTARFRSALARALFR